MTLGFVVAGCGVAPPGDLLLALRSGIGGRSGDSIVLTFMIEGGEFDG